MNNIFCHKWQKKIIIYSNTYIFKSPRYTGGDFMFLYAAAAFRRFLFTR